MKLTGSGVSTVLGELEARVMQVCWASDRALTAREVHERLGTARRGSPLTVITILNRLVTKGLLARAREAGRLRYAPRIDEASYVQQASRRVAEGVLALGPEAVTASIVDVLAERDPEQLAELARLIRRRLREEQDG